ncbi:MAG: hypothetical protein JOZ28_01180 [Candidatus Eremiobacteraeota bacterium]|nr:hypothetical protein [Candidatus Eremiobacteraeota bacterium]
MDRKGFLGATVAAGFGAAALSSPASAADTRLDTLSNRNISYMMIIIQATIDNLNQDEHDYGGHRATAVNLLQQAKAQLEAGLDYFKAHPL